MRDLVQRPVGFKPKTANIEYCISAYYQKEFRIDNLEIFLNIQNRI